VIYSFNASRLVTVWGGWSTRWYAALLNDRAMLEVTWVSLRIAALSATAATVLGTLAAVVLVRAGRFRGRTALSAMVYAPLVMPEVITGLSLLLLFVALNVDRGFWTVAIAHTTLTLSFVTVVVQSRLLDFDRSLEEAAMDLGCPPLRTFITVTLPLIFPAIAAGWMLAFTLSLDDVVIASHTAGRDHAADATYSMRPRSRDQRDLHHHDRAGRDRRGAAALVAKRRRPSAAPVPPAGRQIRDQTLEPDDC
jgi:putrescine transport system permease protein